MKYEPSEQVIPQNKRKEFNEKILYLIDSGKADEFGITGTDIYNLYTGDGGGIHTWNDTSHKACFGGGRRKGKSRRPKGRGYY